MRNVMISVAVIALAIVAAALGGRSENAAAAPASCAKANLSLVKEGQLSIATDNPAFPPWFAGGETKGRPWKINDPAKGKGFESAVAYAVAKRLGFTGNQVVWVYTPFNKTIAPGRKSFDFAINQVSYTPERAKALGFSASYYDVNQSIVGLKGKPIASARSVSGLRKYKLGAQLGTTSYQYIVRNIKPSRSPAVYDTNDAAVAALKNGQIDGLVVDLPTAFYVTAVQVPNGKIVGQFAAKGTQERFGMVFRKGNPLVACVNNALANMKRSGVLKRIQQIWLAKVTGAPVLQ
ncbi:MAG: amino acid ABC transporter substrate-binding protein [Actinobacteria bacterium]|nr:amino acid ABC transporter substrate-binding protein [Actinomycetota bacterium]